MKKLVLLALSVMIMTGCDKSISSVDGYDIVIVDSCEYIRNYTASGNIVVHKGNCRFCQQRLRQMMWEVQDSILNTMD